MTQAPLAFRAAQIFDGSRMLTGGVTLAGGRIVAVGAIARGVPVTDLGRGILAPGFVDLQVNGGGGVMLGDDPIPTSLRRIAGAHARLGATTILPTLISDTPGQVAATIAAMQRSRPPGIAGLHLEGPHLSLARKGAHDAALIRPMGDDDLTALCAAAARFVLIVTVAPEGVTPAQVRALVAAGAVVAIGHTDATVAEARALVDAGATVVTHLFNAMKPMGSRDPGLVGAALTDPRLSAGLIADGIHVDPTAIRVALAAKRGQGGGIFLISDAMATAGTEAKSFTLNDRTILRQDGRLTLADGTLAGADLTLARAVQVLVHDAGVALPDALAMATRLPAEVMRVPAGRLLPGRPADMVLLTPDLRLAGVWQGGERL